MRAGCIKDIMPLFSIKVGSLIYSLVDTGNFALAIMTFNTNNWSTVLFADICQSTFLFETLGDRAALDLITAALELSSEVATQQSGQVIGTIGDEVLCTFESPENALHAANQIHAIIHQQPAMQAHHLAMRIGINSGPVLETGDNVYGSTVNIAARLAQQAKANQTLVSAHTVAHSQSKYSGEFRPIGWLNLSGKAGAFNVHELIAPENQDEVTEVALIQEIKTNAFLLTLRFANHQVQLNPMLVRYLLGRGEECDRVFDHPTISREHAELLYQNGKFLLRDFSTNGSVVFQAGKSVRLHRSSMELRHKGEIYLGRTDRMALFCISFDCALR